GSQDGPEVASYPADHDHRKGGNRPIDIEAPRVYVEYLISVEGPRETGKHGAQRERGYLVARRIYPERGRRCLVLANCCKSATETRADYLLSQQIGDDRGGSDKFVVSRGGLKRYSKEGGTFDSKDADRPTRQFRRLHEEFDN